MKTLLATVLLIVSAGCASGPPMPQPFHPSTDACAFCRMLGSDGRTAAQIVAPSAEPLFFDDIGCLRDYLTREGAPPAGAVAYVVDHRTGGWVEAGRAVYTRNPRLETPMGSHLIAHDSTMSRAGDSATAEGTNLTPAEVFPGVRIPGATP
jgi:copper chaperone NosL